MGSEIQFNSLEDWMVYLLSKSIKIEKPNMRVVTYRGHDTPVLELSHKYPYVRPITVLVKNIDKRAYVGYSTNREIYIPCTFFDFLKEPIYRLDRLVKEDIRKVKSHYIDKEIEVHSDFKERFNNEINK